MDGVLMGRREYQSNEIQHPFVHHLIFGFSESLPDRAQIDEEFNPMQSY